MIIVINTDTNKTTLGFQLQGKPVELSYADYRELEDKSLSSVDIKTLNLLKTYIKIYTTTVVNIQHYPNLEIKQTTDVELKNILSFAKEEKNKSTKTE